MFTWGNAVVLLLQLAVAAVQWVNSQASFDAGAKSEIEKAATKILDMLKVKEETVKQVEGMTEDQVDQGLKGEEP